MTCFSCKVTPDPYLKHDMEWEKIAGDCTGLDPAFNMVSNIVGERYVFQLCLDANFQGGYTVQRKSDTIDVRFHGLPDGAQSLYKITLDINTHPRYNFITIDGSTFVIIPAGV